MCHPDTKLWLQTINCNALLLLGSCKQTNVFSELLANKKRKQEFVSWLRLKVTRDQEKETHQSQSSHVDVFMSTCCPDNYTWSTVRVLNEPRGSANDGEFPPMASLQIEPQDPIGQRSPQPTNDVSRYRIRHPWLFSVTCRCCWMCACVVLTRVDLTNQRHCLGGWDLLGPPFWVTVVWVNWIALSRRVCLIDSGLFNENLLHAFLNTRSQFSDQSQFRNKAEPSVTRASASQV